MFFRKSSEKRRCGLFLSEKKDFIFLNVFSDEFFIIWRFNITNVRLHESNCKSCDLLNIILWTSIFMTFYTDIWLKDLYWRIFKCLKFIFTNCIFFNAINCCNCKNSIVCASQFFITILQLNWFLIVGLIE